jgi:hypothetical protein
MLDALSFAEIDGQHMELLCARTVMSVLTTVATGDGSPGSNGDGTASSTPAGNSGLLATAGSLARPLLSDQALKCDLTPVDWSR